MTYSAALYIEKAKRETTPPRRQESIASPTDQKVKAVAQGVDKTISPAPASRPQNPTRLPSDIIGEIVEFIGTSGKVEGVNRCYKNSIEQKRSKLRSKLWDELRSKPGGPSLIDEYIRLLGLNHLSIPTNEKFTRLFEKMTQALGHVPQSIKHVSRFDPACYEILSREICNYALKNAWPEMRVQLMGPGTRGLPDDSACVDNIRSWLNDPANASVLEGVTRLNLSKLALPVIPEELKKFKNITGLDLSLNGINLLPFDTLSAFKSMRYLNLSYNLLKKIDMHSFAAFERLEVLNLSGNTITEIDLLPFDTLSALRSLRSLNLSYNNLEKIGMDSFSAFERLEVLNLSGNKITEIDSNLFGFNCPSKLKMLDISDNLLAKDNIKTLRRSLGTILFSEYTQIEVDPENWTG